MAEQNDWFPLGVVVGTHGLRGDLRVRPVSADSASLPDATELALRCGDGRSEVCRPLRAIPHKGGWLLRLRGRENREAAEALVGCEVLMRYIELAPLADDEFYWYQLQGLTVVDHSRGELGTLEELLTTAAHDIYIVRGRYGEVLIPAVGPFVTEIDLDARRMTVDLPEGLVPGRDEA